MQSGEARLNRLAAEPFECARGFIRSSETLYKIAQVVEHEHRLAVDFIIRRMREILLDYPVNDLLELIARLRALPDDRRAEVVRQIDVPGVVRVVVCPHYIELDEVVVLRAEVAVIKALLEEGSAVVPVPVVDEHVDAVVMRAGYLALHDIRVGLVDVSPQGLAVPEVVGSFSDRVLDRLPLADPLGPELTGSRFVSGIGRPYISRDIIFLHSVNPFITTLFFIWCSI